MSEFPPSTENMLPLIQTIRGQRVILAADPARIYGVETKRLNEQVRRNKARFPSDFMFQLTAVEAEAHQDSRSQIATLKQAPISNIDRWPSPSMERLWWPACSIAQRRSP